DATLSGRSPVYRTTPAVAGRWGEADAVPGLPTNPVPAVPSAGGYSAWNNPIRAGHSVVFNGSGSYDPPDDNFRGLDLNGAGTARYDAAGQLLPPAERYRRFVNPIDVAGDGRVITFSGYIVNGSTTPPTYQVINNGGDTYGRVNFFRYFRPAGV